MIYELLDKNLGENISKTLYDYFKLSSEDVNVNVNGKSHFERNNEILKKKLTIPSD